MGYNMTDINQEIEELEATLVSLKAKSKAQQEPTLTPVSFESKGELAKALMDGRTFKTPDGTTLVYEDNSTWLSPFRTKHDVGYYHYMRREWNSYADLQEITAELWYLNIPPEGVECYVSVRTPNPSCATRIIFFYNSGYRLPFRSSHDVGWKYATPVNEGEII